MGGSTATPFGDGEPDQLAQFLSRVMPSIAEPSDGYVNIHAFEGVRATYHGGGRAFAGLAEFGLIQSHVQWLNLNESEVFFCLSTQVHTGTTDDRGNRKVGRGSRSRTNARWLKAFVLDLDTKAGGYSSQRAALAALLPFCEGLGVDPLLVSSGRGIHAYVILSESVAPPVWQATADRLIAAAQQAGLKFDVGVTRNAATLLRLPTSFNRKTRDNPLECRVLAWGSETSLAHLGRVLKAVPPPTRSASGPSRPGLDPVAFPPRSPLNGSDAAAVRADLEHARVVTSVDLLCAACPVVADSDERQGDGDLEPLWFELAKLCHYVEDGRDYFHDLSSGDARYDPEQTEKKFDQAQPQGWPHCTTIASSSPAAAKICATCRFAGQGRSPIHFARESTGHVNGTVNGHAHPFVAQSSIGPLSLPDSLQQGPDGRIFTFDGKPVFSTPILKFDLISHPDGAGGFDEGVRIVIPSALPDEQFSVVETSCSTFASAQQMSALAGKGLTWSNVTRAKDGGMELITWMRANRAAYKQGRSGWVAKDGKIVGFSFDGTLYTPEGERSSPAKNHEWYTPTGNFEDWKWAANLYVGKGITDMELVIATGFAAPLMAFTQVDGAIVFVRTAGTGYGKSASLETANSLWASRFSVIQLTTNNALVDQLAQMNNLPVFFDEMRPASKNGELIMTVASGREKNRMSRNLKPIPVRRSRTLLVAAANASLVQEASDNDTNAQAARVFEFDLGDGIRNSGVPDSDRRKARNSMEMNFGVGAIPFVRFIGSHHEMVSAMIGDISDHFKQVLGLTEESRYWIAVAAALYVGATIAKKLDLIAFDTVAIYKLLLELLRRQKSSMQDMAVNADDPDVQSDRLADFLNENLHAIIRTKNKPQPGNKSTTVDNAVDLVHVREYVARIASEDKWLIVSASRLAKWCKQKQYNPTSMKQTLIKAGRCIQAKNRRSLTAQTTINKSSAEEYLLEFDLTHPANERFLPQ